VKRERRAGHAPEGRDEEGSGSPSERSRNFDRAFDVVEALLWIALLAVGTLIALAVLRESSGRPPRTSQSAVEASVEAEHMRVVAKSRPFIFWLQPTSDFLAGRWSKDGHMFAVATQREDWIELELPEQEPGPYRLELLLTKAADYGVVSVSLNGVTIKEEIDLWSDRGVVPTGPLDLGRVELRERGDVLRLDVTGTNPGAAPPYFQFGIDGVRLTRQ